MLLLTAGSQRCSPRRLEIRAGLGVEEANPSLPVLCWWDLVGHLQAQQHASLLLQLYPLGWEGAGTARGTPVLRETSPVSPGLEMQRKGTVQMRRDTKKPAGFFPRKFPSGFKAPYSMKEQLVPGLRLPGEAVVSTRSL